MASISTGADGLRRIFFSGADGQRKIIYLGKIPKKAAEAIKTKVEALVSAVIAGISIDNETADWLSGRDEVMYAKLVKVGLAQQRAGAKRSTLGPFLDSFIAERSDVKGSTSTVYGHSRRCLIEFFGESKPLEAITLADADDWRRYLARAKPAGQALSQNTVNRRCGIAKQFFRAAKRAKLISENPFAEMKGLSVRGNKAREFFITPDMAAKVLDACPDWQWRLLFALSRFGGLRCPSEHLALRWSDIDWANNRFTVHSPKTEHHEGGESRVVPIFPELRPYLEDAREMAEDGADYVLTIRRDAAANLRTRFTKIIKRAGLEPWPKLFQNLRSTRETELVETFPIQVVCAWIGNSEAVAKKHYLQVTEDHFQQAADPTQNPTHYTAKLGKLGQHRASDDFKYAENIDDSRELVGCGVGDEGLEPPTSAL